MSTQSKNPWVVDYKAMNEPQLLEALGDDARKWATAFCQIARSAYDPEDEIEIMTSWFANAIEHSTQVRTERARPQTYPTNLAQLVKEGQARMDNDPEYPKKRGDGG